MSFFYDSENYNKDNNIIDLIVLSFKDSQLSSLRQHYLEYKDLDDLVEIDNFINLYLLNLNINDSNNYTISEIKIQEQFVSFEINHNLISEQNNTKIIFICKIYFDNNFTNTQIKQKLETILKK